MERGLSVAAGVGGGPGGEQQRAKVLASREKQITERIDKDFFAEETSFRPLVHVIDVLGSSDGSVNTVSLERLRGQCELANAAMEEFVDVNYGYLNGNVEAMGKILRKFNETFTDVTSLRKQVSECKVALLDGLKEQNIRQMWIRKKENEYILAMLDKLEMLKETPAVFDDLVKEKKYLAAVIRLNSAIDAMFSKELVDVAAIVKVRDEVLDRKGRFMELVMEDILSALYLRLENTSSSTGNNRGSSLSQGVRNSMGSPAPDEQDDNNNPADGDNNNNLGGTSRSSRAGSQAGGNATQEGSSSRRIRLPTSSIDLTEHGEALLLDDPTQDVGTFMCFMVEAARRLNCLDDLETCASERIRREVRQVAWSHFSRVKAQAMKQRLLATAAEATTQQQGGGNDPTTGGGANDVTAPLHEFLKVLYADFTAIVENHMSLVSLLDTARGKGPTGAGVPPLVSSLWKEMQDYLQEFLHSHIRAEDTEFFISPDALQSDGNEEEEIITPTKKWALPAFPGARPNEGGQVMTFNRSFFAISALVTDSDANPQQAGQQQLQPQGGSGGSELQLLSSATTGSSSSSTSLNSPTNTAGLLCPPEVSNVVGLYRPTLKFVTKVLAIIGSTGESALTRGVVRYLSDFVRQTLIPYLSTQTVNTKLRKILEDKDALSPVQTDRKAANKMPNKAAQQVLDLCRSLHVYSSQLPQHVEGISNILNAALESYISRVTTEMSACMAGTYAATVCSGQQLKEKLHDSLVNKDPAYRVYKAYWAKLQCQQLQHHNHGHHHHGTPVSGASTISDMADGGGASSPDNATAALDEALSLQPELWKFDVYPYAISRTGVTLDKKRLMVMASLAYSADWLGYEVKKFANTTNSTGGRRNRGGCGGGVPSSRGWVDKIANELFEVSETCLLFLRLESEYACYYYMQQLHLTGKFDSTSSSSSSISSPSKHHHHHHHPPPTASSSSMTIGPAAGQPFGQQQQQQQQPQQTVEMCVASLNRYILSLEDAICGVASTEYFALAIAHVPRLLPRLLIHAVRYINKVSTEGIEKLSRVFVALQQTVPILLDGVGPIIGRDAGLLHEVVSGEFARARIFLSLLELDHDKLADYIKAHKTDYQKDDYRSIWLQNGPHKTVTSESAGRFNAVWLA